MTRALGSIGSKRRRTAFLGALLGATMLAVFVLPRAFAVHDEVFELDGNAQTAVPNASSTQEDWDLICKANQAAGECVPDMTLPSGNTAAMSSTFLSDGAPNATIYTGGGSKDDINIDQWKYKSTGGLPDKDNLLHGFAARYSSGGDTLLYFGADRFDNSGDAQIGFWFLQGTVGLQSGGKFGPDAHQIGDLLILSDFTGGGTTPTIRVFKWDPTDPSAIDGSLVELAGNGSGPAECGSSEPAAYCAVVNTGAGVPTPWQFTNKSGENTFAVGELYEGGVNLSDPDLGLSGECFASFLVETRSSQSVDAVLKDFIVGNFQACQSGITSTQSWLPNDSATVSVPGATNWAGTLSFKLTEGTDCTGAVLYEQDFDPGTSGVQPKSINQSTTFPASTANTTYKVTADKDVSWLVEFVSSTTGVIGSTHCETSSLTIDNR